MVEKGCFADKLPTPLCLLSPDALPSRVDVSGLHREPIRRRLEAVGKLWLRRHSTRRALAALNDDELRDIGLTRDDVRREIAKPFWNPWLHL